jgi:hypothetical protein
MEYHSLFKHNPLFMRRTQTEDSRKHMIRRRLENTMDEVSGAWRI